MFGHGGNKSAKIIMVFPSEQMPKNREVMKQGGVMLYFTKDKAS